MASTDGNALLRFGTQAKTGWYVVNISEDHTSEVVEIQDEDGDIATVVSNFGKKAAIKLDLIGKSGTTMVAVGDVFTFPDNAGVTKTIRITGLGNVQNYNTEMKTTVSGTLYPGITPS